MKLLEQIYKLLLIEQMKIGEKKKYILNKGISENEFYELIQQDPTISEIDDNLPTGSYTDWIFSIYLKNKMTENDIPKFKEPLQYFHKHRKALNSTDRNIFNFNSIEELDKQLLKYDWYIRKLGLATRKEEKKNAEIYEVDDWKIIIPRSEGQSIYYGKGTKWCTSSVITTNRFNSYNQKGILWILINKENPYYKMALHIENDQFHNEKNIKLTPEEQHQFIENNMDVFRFILTYLYQKNKTQAFNLWVKLHPELLPLQKEIVNNGIK